MADPKRPRDPTSRVSPVAAVLQRERPSPARPDPQRRAPDPDDERHAPCQGERPPRP